MAIERFKPEGLHATPGYHHVTIVDAGRTAYLVGQCPLDADGDVVGTTHDEAGLAAQVDQVAANALVALAAAGAAPDDVVGGVIYVVSDDGAALASVWKRLTESALAPAFTTASTLLGVSQLGFSHQCVELDLTAALNGRIRHPRVRVARGISRPAAPATAGSTATATGESGDRCGV